MAQITSGFRAIFSHPSVYNFAQRMVGAEKARHRLVHDFFPPMQGLRMLDIGCGTAEILDHLPENMDYSGFDASDEYIAKATARFGHRASFRAELVRQATLDDLAPFDIILAFGLLHHLDNAEATTLFQLAYDALKPGGKLITIDPVYSNQQSALARWIISKDRGQNIRQSHEYLALVESPFDRIESTIRHDMLYIPYSHIILECQKKG